MVWIPGGGFSSGHGGMRLYGPKYLMDKDIIVVTMNYRIGVLGEKMFARQKKKTVKTARLIHRFFEH